MASENPVQLAVQVKTSVELVEASAPRADRQRPIVFIGPSLPLSEARRIVDADFRPPCKRGDLTGLSNTLVALIDGVFHQSQAISPREIDQAIKRNVRVLGAASMGALRANEVPGMIGIGRVYEMYSGGIIDSDDEVAVAFDPDRLTPVTVPLVCIRHAVDRLVQCGTVGSAMGRRVLAAAERLHYTERTYGGIIQAAGLAEMPDAQDLVALLKSIDVKADDARLLLERIAHDEASHRLGALAEGEHVDGDRRDASPWRDTDYGYRVSEAKVSVPREFSEDAPVFVWETGDSLRFSSLVTFLKLTGAFSYYMDRALARVLWTGGLRDASLMASPTRESKRQLRSCETQWGWMTPEEKAVTLSDLGLGQRELLKYLRADAIVRAAPVGLNRTARAGLLRALRSELFANDLALKREAMKCASLAILGRANRRTPRNADLEWAKAAMCRMHRRPTWESVEARLAALAVPRRATREFVGLLARARAALSTIEPSVRSRDRVGPVLRHEPIQKATALQHSVTVVEALGHLNILKRRIGVTRVGMIERLASIEHVYVSQASRPAGAWSSSYGSGKGLSKNEAVVGGIMEEVEKWCQEQYAPEMTWATYAELAKATDTVCPSELSLPFDSGYTPNLPMNWTACRDQLSGGEVMVPAAIVACPAKAGANNILYSRRGGRVVFSTNGLACGFTFTEALIHAVCEYIERHAAKIAELKIDNPGLRQPGGRLPTRIDPSTYPAELLPVVQSLKEDQYILTAWDITSEVRVPTVHARLMKEYDSALGWATHPNPRVALVRAVLEACQALIGSTAGGREDLCVQARSLGRHERPRTHRHAAAAYWMGHFSTPAPLAVDEGCVTDDLAAEWEWLKQRLAEAGVQRVLTADMTTDDVRPVHAVRVLVPGLETTNPFHCGPRARAVLVSDLLSA